MPRTPPAQPDDQPPEDNAEQAEAPQAQDVAADALDPSARTIGIDQGSTRGGHADPGAVSPQDEPDLVERMEQMVSSGHIDMDAFAGEPRMDDEDDRGGDEGGDGGGDDDAIERFTVIPDPDAAIAHDPDD